MVKTPSDQPSFNGNLAVQKRSEKGSGKVLKRDASGRFASSAPQADVDIDTLLKEGTALGVQKATKILKSSKSRPADMMKAAEYLRKEAERRGTGGGKVLSPVMSKLLDRFGLSLMEDNEDEPLFSVGIAGDSDA